MLLPVCIFIIITSIVIYDAVLINRLYRLPALLLVLCLTCTTCFGQKGTQDSLQLWNYLLDTSYHGWKTDTVKPLRQLVFWRTKAIDESSDDSTVLSTFIPVIPFDIFYIKDSGYCFTQSLKTKVFSSCVPPNVGGDIISAGKFILVNHSVCLSCQRYGSQTDYCRPVIHRIFSGIDKTGITTLQSLIRQFPIPGGRLGRRKEKAGAAE